MSYFLLSFSLSSFLFHETSKTKLMYELLKNVNGKRNQTSQRTTVWWLLLTAIHIYGSATNFWRLCVFRLHFLLALKPLQFPICAFELKHFSISWRIFNAFYIWVHRQKRWRFAFFLTASGKIILSYIKISLTLLGSMSQQ